MMFLEFRCPSRSIPVVDTKIPIVSTGRKGCLVLENGGLLDHEGDLGDEKYNLEAPGPLKHRSNNVGN